MESAGSLPANGRRCTDARRRPKLSDSTATRREKKTAGKPRPFILLRERLAADPQLRLLVIVVLMAAGFLTIFLANNVVSHIDTDLWVYRNQRVFPTYPPIGNDFRVGNYNPSYYLAHNGFTSIAPDGSYPSIYPPMVAFFGLPYTLFSPQTAYLIHVALLILVNLACLLITVWMVKKFFLVPGGLSDIAANVVSIVLFFASSFYLFSSYFFAYSMERGNTDIFALFFCLLALLVLVRRPEHLWLQVILLSVAVHLKIYPIVLFPLLFFKHRFKIILPALAVNVAMLFVLGPKMALAFYRSLTAGGGGAGIGNAWSNVANHASYSFTMGIDNSGSEYLTVTFFMIWAAAFLVPLVVWGISCIALWMKKYSASNAIMGFMISVPLMNLLPTMSMDYRLVILAVVICFLLAMIIKQFIQKFTWFDLFQMILLMGVLLMLSRSYAFVDESLAFIRNKYVWVLLVEVLLGVNILRSLKAPSLPAAEKSK